MVRKKGDREYLDDTGQNVRFLDRKGGKTSPSASSMTSLDSTDRLNLATSFMERTRLLSKSPMDGPSAFMLIESNSDPKLPVGDVVECSNEDLSSQQEFQKPVVGKSPLDASPLKSRLSNEDPNEDSELDVDISMDEETEDISPNQDVNKVDVLTSSVSTDRKDSQYAQTRTLGSSSSLPGSRSHSPLTGMSRRHRISESSGGSSSLPASPLVSPKRSGQEPEFFADKSRKRHSEKSPAGGVRSPDADVRRAVTAPTSSAIKTKSATVDLGMLRRISSSPEMVAPIKGKRGIMKFFDSVGDKEGKEKRMTVQLRQTMSGSNLLVRSKSVGEKEGKEKKMTVQLRQQTMGGTNLLVRSKSGKRKSFSGSFSNFEPKQDRQDTMSTFDAMSPNFIFLQFYHSSWFRTDEVPLALPEEEFYQRAVKNLDRIPPYATHKIGVIYVGPNQETDEVAILKNLYGSSRYMNFLSGLGDLIRLRDCALSEVYTGGLDRNGADGEYAYNWTSEIAQIIFHIATLMPNKDKDPNCNCKKLHIGNDFVTIVYNDSKAEYKMGTIKGQFNFVEIVIKPLDNDCNVITLSIKTELKDILTDTNLGPRVISDKNLPKLVRHIALHVNMASVIHQNQKTPSDAYGCNWLQRLHQVKRIRSRVTAATEAQTTSGSVCGKTQRDLHSVVDFTKYILQ